MVIRIERSGKTVYALDINRGGSFGDDKLEFGLGCHRLGNSGINGWAEPYFDRELGQAKLAMMDFSLLESFGGQSNLTKEELFSALWDRIVDVLDTEAGRS